MISRVMPVTAARAKLAAGETLGGQGANVVSAGV
jgi:hypothetical protein